MSATIKGYEAIEFAERNGLTLSKFADPVEGARDGLTVDEAREVAAEDPSLVYVEAQTEEMAYGLTFAQWLSEAGWKGETSRYDLRAAWSAGEDPAEYRQ